jgi:hypothetical protein
MTVYSNVHTSLLTVQSGGKSDATVVNNTEPGAALTVASGSTANGTVAKVATIAFGGVDTNAHVLNGAHINIGGNSQIATVDAGSVAPVQNKGYLGYSTIAGVLSVVAGGTSDTNVIDVGGNALISGSSLSDTVYNGAAMTVLGVGTATGTAISGTVTVSGKLNTSYVEYNGQAKIGNGGVATRAHVFLGGVMTVQSGGKSTGTIADQGGAVDVLTGGQSVGDRGGNGGEYNIAAGAMINTFQGGLSFVNVDAGAIVRGGFKLGSNTTATFNCAVPAQAVTFSDKSNNKLILNDPSTFAATIYEWALGNTISLPTVLFAGATRAWVQNGATGTLTIVSGSTSVSLLFAGAFTSANFVLADDGLGGVLIKHN